MKDTLIETLLDKHASRMAMNEGRDLVEIKRTLLTILMFAAFFAGIFLPGIVFRSLFGIAWIQVHFTLVIAVGIILTGILLIPIIMAFNAVDKKRKDQVEKRYIELRGQLVERYKNIIETEVNE
jgi:hypothetical protein